VPSNGAVTVVIPTHNRRELLLRTLDSVRRQKGVEVRVVVVDDGGRDGTADAVRRLGHEDIRVLVHADSKGVSAARNAGLAQVDTRWVAFVDDDDLWAPEKLTSQLDALAATGALWSCVGALHVDSDLVVSRVRTAPVTGDVSEQMLKGHVIPGGGSGVLADTDLARAVGGFDERISIVADWDFYLRLSLRSPLAAVREALVAYYVHSDSMFHDPLGVLAELRYMVRKYRDFDGRRGVEPDWGYWYVTLARMARGIGKPATATRIISQGLVRAPVPIARDLTFRTLTKLRRRENKARAALEGRPDWLEYYAVGRAE
jgi:glycosyltransferase involved in cell wall biosynthesis